MRVVGQEITFQGLIDALGEVEGQKYQTIYLPVTEALALQEKAQIAGDQDDEMFWSLRTLGASGNAVVAGPWDNARFDLKTETVKETFERVFGQ
jgi:hypothetical protein